MLRSDNEKWKRLMTAIYPRRLSAITEDELLGWYLVLKPWTYEQCKEALLNYSRMSGYVPDPTEIAGYLAKRYPVTEEEEHEAPDIEPTWAEFVKAKLKYYADHKVQTLSAYCLTHEGSVEDLYDGWQAELIAAGATDPPLLRRR